MYAFDSHQIVKHPLWGGEGLFALRELFSDHLCKCVNMVFGICVAGVWEIQAGESNQMVHMNILISCVLAAFLLGAFIAGMVVYCYRDAFLRTPRKIQKDAESAQSCTDSTGSFASSTVCLTVL